MRASQFGPSDFYALTGLTTEEMTRVTEELRGPVRDVSRGGRPTQFGHEQRVLALLIHLRTNLTERGLAAIFEVSQPTIHRAIVDLLPRLADRFKPDLDPGVDLVMDGTLIPVHDHSITAKSKNSRRSVNVQVVSEQESRRIAQIGEAWPGNRNDIVVARETIVLPDNVTTLTDGGYRL